VVLVSAGGAAQAVGLLLSVVSATRLYPDGMRNCSDCDGPLTFCPACKHYHCDEDGCMPVECQQKLEEE
jgi:hypothetical protein